MSVPDEPGGARRLVLLRHAKAEAHARTDSERPLALRGRQQAVAVGESLAASGWSPDLVLVSSAVRTRQTWELVNRSLPGDREVRVLPELYSAGPADVLTLVRAVAQGTLGVLVVGHEPVMSSLAAYLASPESDAVSAQRVRTGISTAMRCELTVPGGWDALGHAGAHLTAVRAAD